MTGAIPRRRPKKNKGTLLLFAKSDPDKERCARILDSLECHFGKEGTELTYANAFQLLVAVVLSAQCTDKLVNAVTPALFRAFPDCGAVANALPPQFKALIRRCGLFNTKGDNIIKTAKILLAKTGGVIPNDFDFLVSLPGIGRKTANVILCELFNAERIAVDTHVFRVSQRLGLASGNSVETTERELTALIPGPRRRAAHHQMIRLGRHYCQARAPLCSTCPLNKDCPSAGLGIKKRIGKTGSPSSG